ncbi:hypothetical protein BC833DRAFT_535205 [Globomyces pollinis-pini]|nr:hypothetical protein BC833DRAFT_535205 [Globomyces pollinis-pini]
MKLSLLLAFLVANVAAQCSNPSVRKEWSQLSRGEKDAYLNAVTALKNRAPAGRTDYARWNYNQFADLHIEMALDNHSKAPFLPWHRWFIHHYEQALQSVNPSIILPYWDWTLDSENPTAADVFKDFGLNGNPASGYCMTTGIAKGWTVTAGPNRAGKCLVRTNDWSKKLWSPESVTNLLRTPDFSTFWTSLENGPHGMVHNAIGGANGDFKQMWSTNDPIFFLHHGMVDKVWWRWQSACKENVGKYAGSSSYRLAPYPRTVADVSNTQAGPFCYTYSASRGDTAFTLDKNMCPSGQLGVTTTTAAATATTTSTAKATPTNAPTTEGEWLKSLIKQLIVKQTRQSKRDLYAQPNGYGAGNVTTMTLAADVYSTMGAYPVTMTQAAGSYPSPKPLPVYKPYPNVTIFAPPIGDLTDKVHIRHIGSLDRDYIINMRMDEYAVRKLEVEARHVIDYYNNLPGYVSPAALVNQIKAQEKAEAEAKAHEQKTAAYKASEPEPSKESGKKHKCVKHNHSK